MFRCLSIYLVFLLNSLVYGESIEKILFELASKFNQNLPMFVDSETKLYKTAAAGKNFKYFYTMINITKKNAHVEEFKEQVIPIARNQYCTSTEMKAFRKYGVSSTHSYFDKNGIELTIFTFQPSDC